MSVIVHDVGLRDGLQIEKAIVPTETKLEWLDRLVASGLDMIQVGSFVHQQKVPQMADTDELFTHLAARRPPGVTFSALVLNEKGMERAFAAGVTYLCMGVSASDTHSRKNTGMSTEEAATRIIAMARQAVAAGTRVQVSVQSAFGCGFEGLIPTERVLGLVRRFLEAGLPTISLADTAGHAHPRQVEELFGVIRALDPAVECACHFHETYGLGLANCYAAWRAGVTYFEAAFGGLGGCPFTAVTAGNVCTEDLVHLLHRMDLRQDIQLAPIVAVTRDAATLFHRRLPGTVHRTALVGDTAPAS
jgi:hydroxymethylglutaryl-CoA lyase